MPASSHFGQRAPQYYPLSPSTPRIQEFSYDRPPIDPYLAMTIPFGLKSWTLGLFLHGRSPWMPPLPYSADNITGSASQCPAQTRLTCMLDVHLWPGSPLLAASPEAGPGGPAVTCSRAVLILHATADTANRDLHLRRCQFASCNAFLTASFLTAAVPADLLLGACPTCPNQLGTCCVGRPSQGRMRHGTAQMHRMCVQLAI